MKMFKKLMAVALAGVMALVVLTGCAASVNKKELVALLSDMDSRDHISKIEYKETSKDQANKVIDLVQKAYNSTKDEDKANFDPMEALRDKTVIVRNQDTYYKLYPEVKKALGIDDKTEDGYSFAIVELKKYSSQYNQDHATTALATDVMSARKYLNKSASGNNGTVSINTVTLGSTEYLVVVFKVVA